MEKKDTDYVTRVELREELETVRNYLEERIQNLAEITEKNFIRLEKKIDKLANLITNHILFHERSLNQE